MKLTINQLVRFRTLRWLFITAIAACTAIYLVLYAVVSIHAYKLLRHPYIPKSDAALILGNRAYLHGTANPCLAGRIDEGLLLARQGVVSTLAMTGGRDNEDYIIEAEFMAAYAKHKGYKGTMLVESSSRSTKENLEFSAPILKAANIKSVIIVSEPYHLWRTEKLVQAGHLGRDFDVAYAGASSQCWTTWGMMFKGTLREPLAIIDNYAKGYFKQH